MKTISLENYLPENAISYITKWLEGHRCMIKIRKPRQSKLGDYKLLPNQSHQISINENLKPELFFFVLTHEIAHLLAFNEKRDILPHGKEWKATFRELLLESIQIYPEDLQILLKNFTQNPKANFMTSPELVKYFEHKTSENQFYVEELSINGKFIYQSQIYQVEEKKKKRYLCKNLHTGKRYLFKSCARVEKIESNEFK
ncbi:MAG: transcription elongation protein SprT [Flavobacteriaceae bacterium]|nr:transcription elongation protein SprT [Flavobacteriaceae bacterium]